VILLALKLSGQPAPVASVASSHLRRGLELARTGDLGGAEAELRQAVALAPDRPEYLTRLGGILAMQQKFKEALPFFETALRLQPGDPQILRNLAASQWGVGSLAEASRNLEHVLKLQPGDVESVFLLGMIAERSNRYDRAAALLGSISATVEQRPDGMLALANAYYRTDRGADAAELLQRMPKLRPSLDLLFRGAQWALAAGDSGTAESLLASVRSSESPKTRELRYLEIMNALADMGRPAAGLEAVELGLKELPASATLYASRGLLETQLHRYRQAVISYRRATELAPANADMALGLAVTQSAAGMIAEAEQTLKKSIQLFPDNALMNLHYGTLLLQLSERGDGGAAARAEAHLKRAIALDPSLAEAHYRLGNLALGADKPGEAVLHLETAAKLDPRSSKTHLALARAYNRTGRQDEASRSQRRFLDLKTEEEKAKPASSSMNIP